MHRVGRSSLDPHDPSSDDAAADDERAPHLTFLTDDPGLSGQFRVYVARGQRLRVGTATAPTEQDVKVAGLGVTPETAIFTMRPPRYASGHAPSDGQGVGVLCVAPAQPNAQVRVNGVLLKYKASAATGDDDTEALALPSSRR